MSAIHQLFRLQQVDLEIAEGKKELMGVLQAQQVPDALRRAKQTAEETAAIQKQWRTQQKQQDLELGSVQSKLQTSEERLYSGQVKSPKELADLQKSVELLRKQRATLEESLLETMMTLEEAEKDAQTAEATLQTDTAAWQTQVAQLKQEQLRLATRLNEIIAVRDEQAKLIPAAILADYDALRLRRTGAVVVEVRLGMCQACRVILPAALVHTVSEGTKLVHCSSCDRLLYQV